VIRTHDRSNQTFFLNQFTIGFGMKLGKAAEFFFTLYGEASDLETADVLQECNWLVILFKQPLRWCRGPNFLLHASHAKFLT